MRPDRDQIALKRDRQRRHGAAGIAQIHAQHRRGALRLIDVPAVTFMITADDLDVVAFAIHEVRSQRARAHRRRQIERRTRDDTIHRPGEDIFAHQRHAEGLRTLRQ